LQLKLIYIIQLLLQLQLTATYFSVIFLFQLQLQLTEGTLLVNRQYGLVNSKYVVILTPAYRSRDMGHAQ